MERILKLESLNKKKQIAYCIVYRPMVIDAHGDSMTEEEIEKMAYNFAKEGRLCKIDTNHDNVSNGSYIVESWIVKEGDPLFNKPVDVGSWAVGIKVPNIEIWERIERGELSGVSMEAFANKSLKLTEVVSESSFCGATLPHDDHVHWFIVFLNGDGSIVYGKTDAVEYNGAIHSHEIYTTSVTTESNGHVHRYSLQGESF